jgi:hypothetical protein
MRLLRIGWLKPGIVYCVARALQSGTRPHGAPRTLDFIGSSRSTACSCTTFILHSKFMSRVVLYHVRLHHLRILNCFYYNTCKVADRRRCCMLYQTRSALRSIYETWFGDKGVVTLLYGFAQGYFFACTSMKVAPRLGWDEACLGLLMHLLHHQHELPLVDAWLRGRHLQNHLDATEALPFHEPPSHSTQHRLRDIRKARNRSTPLCCRLYVFYY